MVSLTTLWPSSRSASAQTEYVIPPISMMGTLRLPTRRATLLCSAGSVLRIRAVLVAAVAPSGIGCAYASMS